MQVLSECFPDVEEERLRETLHECGGDISDAAQILLPSAPPTHCTPSRGAAEPCCSKDVDQTPQVELSKSGLLQEHRAKFRSEKFFDLVINRDKLWRSALSFYKNCRHRPERLFYALRIEFDGEEGVDAGALRREFFQGLMKEMNDKLFEGALTRRVPKRDSNIENNFQSAGMMIGHSVMQGGPSFPCLCPALFSVLLFGDKDKALEELPSVNDIPRNAATFGLISLIEEVSIVTQNSST